jgi:hypothetical protein
MRLFLLNITIISVLISINWSVLQSITFKWYHTEILPTTIGLKRREYADKGQLFKDQRQESS